jgi:hypothetical protein
VAGKECAESQHEREGGNGLRPVEEGVDHHSGSDEKHEDKVDGKRVEEAGRLKMVSGESGEVGESPAAADTATGEDAISRFAFEPNASTEQDEADRESTENFAAGSPCLEFPGQEGGNADYEAGDTDFA